VRVTGTVTFEGENRVLTSRITVCYIIQSTEFPKTLKIFNTVFVLKARKKKDETERESKEERERERQTDRQIAVCEPRFENRWVS
jgi:hypothetical protein